MKTRAQKAPAQTANTQDEVGEGQRDGSSEQSDAVAAAASPKKLRGKRVPASSGSSSEDDVERSKAGTRRRSRRKQKASAKTANKEDEDGGSSSEEGTESPKKPRGKRVPASSGSSSEEDVEPPKAGTRQSSRKQKASAKTANKDDEDGGSSSEEEGTEHPKARTRRRSPRKKKASAKTANKEDEDGGSSSEESTAPTAGDADPATPNSGKKKVAPRRSPRKAPAQGEGPRGPRGQRSSSGDQGDGESGGTDLILPYSRSFTFFQRFYNLKTAEHHVKFARVQDSAIRSRSLISDNKPFDWLLSMQSQTPRSVDFATGPAHDAASGHIGCPSSTLSQTSFVSSRACEDRDRDDADFSLWGDQIPQDMQWMNPPIVTLAKKISAMSRRPSTRATSADAASGNDIFIGSSHLGLHNFISHANDDIELLDFSMALGKTARVWHSSKLIKDGMMWRSIVSVLNNESGSSGEAMEFLTEHEADVEFLGIAGVYTKPNIDRTIAAFNIHSMMLIRFNSRGGFTEIGCIVTSRELLSSSIQERLMQICQLLQLCRHGHSEVKFKIPQSSKRIDIETKTSLIRGGFTFPSLDNNTVSNHWSCSGKTVFLMSKYTFAQAWLKYYDAIRLDDNSRPTYGNAGFMDAVVNDIFKELLCFECNLAPGSGLLYQNGLLPKISDMNDWEAETELTEDLVKQTASTVITHASRSTHFPLCVIVHAVAARLKSGQKPCGIMEVSSELLQDIDIAIYSPSSTFTSFRGDRHQYRLYCRRCKSYLTNEGIRLHDLMSNAAISIMSHYDVFPFSRDDPVPSDTELDDQFWTCPPLISSVQELKFANTRNKHLMEYDNDRTAPIKSNRCRYGQIKTGDRKFDKLWDDRQQRINKIHLMSFTEAVLIDANPGHDESTEVNRRFLTRSLLTCLFERMFIVTTILKEEENNEGYDPDSIEEKASNFVGHANQQYPDRDEFIKEAGVNAEFAAALRTYAGLAAVMDHIFCLNLSVCSDMIAGANYHPDLGRKLNEFFDCVGFDVCDVTKGDLVLGVTGVDVILKTPIVMDGRPFVEPMQRQDKVPLSGMGRGWDSAEARAWFQDNPAEKNTRASSAHETSEDLLLTRSITHIKYTRTASGERKYFFKCDFTGAINRDPKTPTKHKRVIFQEQFDCSAEFVKSLPFDVVKGWRQNRWHDLSAHMKPLKQHISRTERLAIKSIQLWRKDSCLGIVFRVVQERATDGGVENEVIYVEGEAMARDFAHEKWIFHQLMHLSSVRSGLLVNVGDGATPSTIATQRTAARKIGEMVDSAPDMSQGPNKRSREEQAVANIWWSRDNELKQCVQGCITNLLHHMKAGSEATRFRRLSTLDDASLMKELKIERFPKNVSINGRTDDFEKCKWLLCAHFKCRYTKPLNITQFRSLSAMVDNLSQIKFPVVVSMKITNAMYNHVIIVWNKTIIDFEQPSTYPLTVNNLDFSCGPLSTFLAVERGYGILPSKAMKKATNITDWGESDVNEELKNLFLGGRRKKKKKGSNN